MCREGGGFQHCPLGQILFSFELSCMTKIFPSQLFLCSLDADIGKEEHCHVLLVLYEQLQK